MLRLALMLALLPFAAAAGCRDFDFESVPYTICEVQASQDLRMFQSGQNGPLGSFTAVEAGLASEGKTLGFAMNAGMYHADYSPVGLYLSDGETAGELVTGASNDNFGMLPNGVFCSGGARPYQVIESRAFAKARPDCRLATQSGPMLVIDGALHPRFLIDSDSRHIRNGVGVSADGGTAWFAISDRAVTFHEFGRLFRDGLGARDALYFDGSVSRLYAPALNRADFGRRLGPIIGYTEQE